MAFKLGIDSNGNYGYYKAGADSVTPFRTGNATAAQVLSGYTFANASSHDVTGTMPNNGAISTTITPRASAQTYTIPAGYHNGNGKVIVNGTGGASKAYAYYFNPCQANRVIPYPSGFNKHNTQVVVCRCWRDDDQRFYNESCTLNDNNITYGSYNYGSGVFVSNLLVIQRTDI